MAVDGSDKVRPYLHLAGVAAGIVDRGRDRPFVTRHDFLSQRESRGALGPSTNHCLGRDDCVQAKPHAAHGDERFGAIRYIQRAQNGGRVDLDGAFGQIECSADQLVGLALHEQREHLGLALGKSGLSRRAHG